MKRRVAIGRIDHSRRSQIYKNYFLKIPNNLVLQPLPSPAFSRNRGGGARATQGQNGRWTAASSEQGALPFVSEERQRSTGRFVKRMGWVGESLMMRERSG